MSKELLGNVLFYGVSAPRPRRVVEFFLEREAAEAMIGEVREYEPELAEDLRVENHRVGLIQSTRVSA